MTYAESLTLAEKAGIDCAKLWIATAVRDWLKYNKKRGDNLKKSLFEDYCRAIYKIWLDVEETSIDHCVEGLFFGLDDEIVTLEGVLNGGEEFEKAKDIAVEQVYHW